MLKVRVRDTVQRAQRSAEPRVLAVRLTGAGRSASALQHLLVLGSSILEPNLNLQSKSNETINKKKNLFSVFVRRKCRQL
jgi:hypothetical protein